MDITGTSCAKILNLQDKEINVDSESIHPVAFSDNLLVMSTEFLLPDMDQPILFDGNKKASMIQQFITCVDFGKLEYLFIDTPPTTSEEILTIMKLLEHKQMEVVFVSQPSDVSDNAVQKSIRYLKEEGMNISGLIANMDGHICTECGHHDKLFIHDDMTSVELAEKYSIPFLGGVPTGLMTKGPKGEMVLRDKQFQQIAHKIITNKPAKNKKKFGKVSIFKKLGTLTKEVAKSYGGP